MREKFNNLQKLQKYAFFSFFRALFIDDGVEFSFVVEIQNIFMRINLHQSMFAMPNETNFGDRTLI